MKTLGTFRSQYEVAQIEMYRLKNRSGSQNCSTRQLKPYAALPCRNRDPQRPSLTLAGIPAEVFDYKLGSRSALDWIIINTA